jgi:serine/threonine-protein kinase RsbW
VRDGFITGNLHPAVEFTGSTHLHNAILNREAAVCLDSKSCNPIIYKESNVSRIEELTLPSKIESVEDAAETAARLAKDWDYGEEYLTAIDLAVRESVANAVKHGNKFAETKLVEVAFVDSEAGFEVRVRDYGEGFDYEHVPDPTDPANLLKSNGRGIFFMRTFMDEVEWSANADGGVTVRMLKRR